MKEARAQVQPPVKSVAASTSTTTSKGKSKKRPPRQQVLPASTEDDGSDDSESDNEAARRVTKVVTQTAAPQASKTPKNQTEKPTKTAPKKRTVAEMEEEEEKEEALTFEVEEPAEPEPPAKKQKVKPKMRPIPEPNLAVPAPQLPSGGRIDISSSDPPVAGSSKHPGAIRSSDAVGTEDQILACASSARRKPGFRYPRQ
ncbi:hypothetical protein FRC09_019898 [Ceratobasidium sp. 395]|nr:hypothetical protein FRC09_019898 [Ceratobasidium sp. 395]